jgi:RNA polymerase primary sigma factor
MGDLKNLPPLGDDRLMNDDEVTYLGALSDDVEGQWDGADHGFWNGEGRVRASSVFGESSYHLHNLEPRPGNDHIFHYAKPEELTPDQWAEVVGVPQDGHNNLTRARFVDKADARSFNHLISSNMGLVVSIAKQFQFKTSSSHLPFQDAVQEGAMGLVRAVEKYDPRKGCEFSTYAAWWIKGSIMKAMSDKSRIIRLPRKVSEMVVRIKKAERELSAAHGRAPTPEELAAHVECTPEKVRFYLLQSKPIMSMEYKDRKMRSFSDPAPGPDHHAEWSSTVDMVTPIVRSLTAREQDIIRMRFGLSGSPPKSPEEVSNVFCLTAATVRKIEARALAKLKSSHLELQDSW